MQLHESEIVIVGAGIIGLTTALAMAGKGYKVTILDHASPQLNATVGNSRVYAINPAAKNLLTQLAVWQYLDNNRIVDYQRMHVWDALSKAYIDFDARMVVATALGYIVEDAMLRQALVQRMAKESNIILCSNSLVTSIKQQDQAISIETTTDRWQARLLIIADGAQSLCRKLLHISLTSRSYYQEAIVAKVITDKPHQSTAYQVFHPDGPLAFLPLSHTQHCSIVWSTTTTSAQHLMQMPDDQFNIKLTTAFANKLGPVMVDSKRHSFPLTMQHVKQYSGANWIILGDAAHTFHPLAGLGLNVGFADIHSWLSVLDTYKAINKKALGAYQRQRKHAVWQTILLIDSLKALFSTSTFPIPGLRSLGMLACNNLSPIKKFCINHAIGSL